MALAMHKVKLPATFGKESSVVGSALFLGRFGPCGLSISGESTVYYTSGSTNTIAEVLGKDLGLD